jgi:ubiquinone/menaquinone biosynthesis C-methylase UbiE
MTSTAAPTPASPHSSRAASPAAQPGRGIVSAGPEAEAESQLVAQQRVTWDRFAEDYDVMSAAHEDSAELDFYLALAPQPARVLELGAGTGRVALPLAQVGHDVTAVDLSERMLAKLTGKRPMRTVRADMTQLDLPGESFDLVLCVCNSLSYLTSPQLQRAALGVMARHLSDGGTAVVHTTSPCALIREWGRGPQVVPSLVSQDSTILMAAKLRTDLQELRISHLQQDGDAWSTHSLHERYVWPSELALMAELEGLRVRDVWGGWSWQPIDLRADHLLVVLERAESRTASPSQDPA